MRRNSDSAFCSLDFSQLPRRVGGEAADLFKLLAHDGAAAKAVQHIPELGLDYISSRLSEGSRLGPLAGPKVASLFEHFRNTYDLVVINAPSLDDAPEVRLLASWADHVLLAVRAGSTSRDVVAKHFDPVCRDVGSRFSCQALVCPDARSTVRARAFGSGAVINIDFDALLSPLQNNGGTVDKHRTCNQCFRPRCIWPETTAMTPRRPGLITRVFRYGSQPIDQTVAAKPASFV